MTAAQTSRPTKPADEAAIVLNPFEVIADEFSRNVKAGLSADLTVLYPQLQN